MLDKQQKIIIAVLAVAIVILVAFLLWLIFRPKNDLINSAQNATSTVQTGNQLVQSADLEAATKERIAEEKNYPLAAKQVAMVFAERYASYSSDEPIKSLIDLEPLMTEEFSKSLRAAAQQRDFGNVFSGYSAKALSADLGESSANKADIAVRLQIEQTVGENEKTNVLYRVIGIKLIKEGEEWKVESAVWQ